MAQGQKNLTTKQQAFVNAYLKSFNATGAAREAGYKQPEASGYENINKPEIKAAINERLDQIREEGLARREARLATLYDLHDDLTTIQRARAQEARERVEDGEALPAGSETGLLIESKKQVGKYTETVWNIDTTLVKERQNILEQVAKEVGHRDKRLVELSGPAGGPVQIESAKAKLLELIDG